MTAQQLKNSILQMAVQGKLVPQDPNDEPASVLLERIRAEKEQLIKEKKIKREKNPSVIFRGADNTPYEKIGDEVVPLDVPFDIPDNWEWCRLVSVNDMYTGNSINETEKKLHYTGLSDGHFYIGTKDVGFDHVITYDNGVRIPFAKDQFRIAPKDSILLCIEGGSAGRKIAFTNQDVCFGNKLCCFVSFGIDYKFLYYYLQSPLFQAAFKENTTGIIGGVSVNTLKAMLLPVPPLAEQKRIVCEIEKYETLLEQYDTAEQALTRLNTSFPEQLKKSILQQAVQGKLVPQDPSDEPAEALLERIRAEKQRLIKEGKIKKDKHESVIFRRDNSHYEKLDGVERCIDDEIPFEIPESWAWVRLGTALINRDAERIPLSVNERSRLEKKYDYYGASGVIDKVDRFLFEKPLLLIGEDGANLLLRSKPIAFIATGQYWVNNHAHVLDSVSGLLLDYVSLYINAINLAPYVTGTAQPKMNQEKMNSIFIPIPPTNEQYRIVKRIEELFPICEQL